ncbi:SDR family oxidoreductase [Streptomyces neyagawaensis]|uniref:SDR family oxidoreductase n=1 Tax=Streptomyces neyagawaensis TaxID=42238 RepID=UPI0006E33145|nr:SDR family oxidoreductase [Streptomyces neyagawaensis]MCL6737453.1 SDR family oxidoreductase [Streptomyces neyagawaensis]MDE1688263.1 SDR family oxidoreductase [Streptomyces neyagawaensis]
MTGRRVAVVTGAARGIGTATVRRLARDGWAVVAVDRCADDPDVPYPRADPGRLDLLAQEFPLISTVRADVRDAAALQRAVELAETEFGGLDTGVHAVAVSPGSTRTDMLRATADLYHLPDVDQLAAQQLTGRPLEPEEVAAAVAWACSPESFALTGSVLHADGGFTA